MHRIKQFINSFGLPRIIIGLFLLLLFVVAPFVGVKVSTSINDTIVRFGMNGVLVLAMVPMIHSGCGLNFGLPLGIIAGLLGATLSLEAELHGFAGFLMAIVFATPFALLLGWGYGRLLNKVKGGRDDDRHHVGFSSVAFMCMMWLLLPYKNRRCLGVQRRGA
jgi:simple sugar transport system permease protein